MGTKYRPYLTFLLVAALLSACTSFDPRGDYDRQYDALVKQSRSPSREASLLRLASEANARASSAKEAQDKVNYYARAATYAWAAGTEGALSQVILNADAGKRLCQTFPADQFKPARDCALLVAYGPVAAGEAALNQIDAHKPDSPTTTAVNLDSLMMIDTQAERFERIVVRQWPTVDRDMARGKVPAGTVEWFNESKRRQWCRFYVMTNQAKRWKLGSGNQVQSRQTRTALAKHANAVFAAGNKLVGTRNRTAALNACVPLTHISQPAVPAIADE